MVKRCNDTEFINFLQTELAISPTSIGVMLRHRESDSAPLPMILWQYGLVSLDQLTQIFDWLENKAQVSICSWVIEMEI
ncbi:DUF2949 domain-containing protein [Gloeocapsopsis crepidinum LEGE 06123]|uniref:DUF2949 domain-containing protein n=1 Tax=Gloeocapsopsis crepidinum LEGE 06123 TaxID=588587 RepID=A0ABR9UW99_9CHRO|nr:DUF2949 domain-containing protein [Gloeocapsopsis crepidinum]MBE9191860.1 DUF2949 domain-containing protein [Gloeocapsopsis crepidinum LEGE 06123]